MATVPQQAVETRGRRLRLLVPEMWPSLAIAVMWLVVLFDALLGPDIVTSSAGSFTRIPSAIVVVFFAYFATRVVARYGYGHSRATPTDDRREQ